VSRSKGDAVALLLVDLLAEGLPEPETEFRFDTMRRWRFDLAWVHEGAAVEIDGGTWTGGRHTTGSGYEKDCEKHNAAVLMGWRVFRFTTGQARDGTAIMVLREALR
jgi:very-short-patch-repair endonuclease